MAKPPPRLFIDGTLTKDSAVALSIEQAHYLAKVLRLSVDGTLILFNGKDGEWRCDIDSLSRKGAIAIAREELRRQTTLPDLTLLFAPVKKAPTEFLIQKATELGVRHLVPVRTDRTIESKASLRWPMIAAEAAEQCERLCVPDIADLCSLEGALAAIPEHQIIFADEARNAMPMMTFLQKQTTPQQEQKTPPNVPWAILIGPAGGFTDDERNFLQRDPRTNSVSLGPRILKTETAALLAVTLWQAQLGDFTIAV